MQNKTLKVMMAVGITMVIWATLTVADLVFDAVSPTYHQITEEIDERDIDTGNALNYSGDETSSDAVFEAEQTFHHPPGLEKE